MRNLWSIEKMWTYGRVKEHRTEKKNFQKQPTSGFEYLEVKNKTLKKWNPDSFD